MQKSPTQIGLFFMQESFEGVYCRYSLNASYVCGALGSWKLYVSFAKEPYKKNDILQKRPKCSLGVWGSLAKETTGRLPKFKRAPNNWGSFACKSPVQIGFFFKQDRSERMN